MVQAAASGRQLLKGAVAENCPMEIAIFERMEAELVRQGLMVPMASIHPGLVAFWGAQMLHSSAEYDNPEATHGARLDSWLHYLLGACRFIHYLKCINRDCLWSRPDIEDKLNDWLRNYVDAQPDHSGAREQAKHPLLAAQVKVVTDGAFHHLTFYCQPNYQLEGLNHPLRHEFRIPNLAYRPSSLH